MDRRSVRSEVHDRSEAHSSVEFQVTKLPRNRVLITHTRDGILDSIRCTDLEAIGLMWKIHYLMGGKGTISDSTRD